MNAISCNDDRLRVLLSAEEESDAFAAAARHVETCPACQARLTTLAGDEQDWNEAQASLATDEPRWRPENSNTVFFQSETRSSKSEFETDAIRRLLASPSHPEMLGRLGRYDIERVIGSGGMGVVLKAHDSELNRPVAIKVLASHLAHVGAARERFAREGRAAAAVVHEHVVAIYNVETDGAVPFLVMQYVPGRSLQARVDEDGPMGALQVLRIGVQAAAGLAAAHRQGLVHRDVKPSNILLEDTVERAVLTDFGLARAMDDASMTQTGIVAGTPHYRSPEQASGGPIDHRSDLFSLGSVLYFMATGRPPFRATGTLAVLHRICREPHRAAWQLNAEVPDELCDVIDRLLEKKPARRFGTAEEVSQHLAELLRRAQQRGLGRRRFRLARFWTHRWATLAAAASVAVVAIVVAAIQNRPGSINEEARPIANAAAAAPAEPAMPTADPQLAVRRQEMDAEDREFAAAMVAVQAGIGQPRDGGAYLQEPDEGWRRDLEEIDRMLKELEAGRVLSQ